MNLPNNEEQIQINDRVRTYLTQGRIDAAITEACSGASQDTIDLLVYTVLKSEQLWTGKKKVPHQALKAAELGASPKAINALIQACARKGWIEGALKTAKMRGIPLSQGETDAIVEGCVNQAEPSKALKAATLGASQKAVDFLVATCAQNGSKEWLKIGAEAVKRFGASSSIIDKLILSIIQERHFSLAVDFGDEVLDLAVRGASCQAVAVLFEAIIDKSYKDDLRDKALALSVPLEVVNALLESLVKQGRTYWGQRVARSFGRPLTTKEMDVLVAVNASKGEVEAVWEAAMFRGSPLTTAEEDMLIKNFRKHKWRPAGGALAEENTALSRYHAMFGIRDAVRGAELGKEEAITFLVQMNSPLGLTNEFQRQSQLRGRRRSVQEIDAQAAKALTWLKTYDALNIAELGASDEMREKVFQRCMEECPVLPVDMIPRAARLRGREFSPKERELIVNGYVEKGSIIDALKAAEIRGRPLSDQEKQSVAENYVEDKGNLRRMDSAYCYRHGRFMLPYSDERDWGQDPDHLAECIKKGELHGAFCWSRDARRDEIIAVIEAFQRRVESETKPPHNSSNRTTSILPWYKRLLNCLRYY